MKPTIGKTVHYYSFYTGDNPFYTEDKGIVNLIGDKGIVNLPDTPNGATLAAIVVGIVDKDKEIVNLQVFPNDPHHDMVFVPNVERGLFSGMWSWPPLDPPISHNMRVGGIDVHP